MLRMCTQMGVRLYRADLHVVVVVHGEQHAELSLQVRRGEHSGGGGWIRMQQKERHLHNINI